MKKIDLSVSSIISISIMLLSLGYFCEAGIARTEVPMRCHTCDTETCKSFKKSNEPKECTVDDLNRENFGPSKLYQFSEIPFKPIDQDVPEFVCQKIVAYDQHDEYVVRRCQLKAPGNLNDSCTSFYAKNSKDPEHTYFNVSCYICNDWQGCNSSGFVYIWVPLLLVSIVSCLLAK